MLSDIFPTGFHGAVTAGVEVGSTVYVAGAGPVGLAAAASAQLLGAAVVVVGDLVPDRLEQARSFGCETAARRSTSAPRTSPGSSRNCSAYPRSTPPSTASASRRAATGRTRTSRPRRRSSTH